ncbi:response regulator [Lachnospiraceae bacterium]|nr:response regulator [Lachnospiraceae bacterium]
MRYRVVLADDEEEVLFGIRNNLDWESYGFEVAGAFSNGRDVLDFLQTQEVDIVITDIRMPFMDGIELAKNIREHHPQVKIIIISGYSDFGYAKEAMSCRVTDYILKPVNAKEMGEVLKRAKEMLQRELEERKNTALLKQQYEESLPVIRDHLLNRIVEGNADWDDLNGRLRRCGVLIADAAFWVAALFQFDNAEGMEGQYTPMYVRNRLKEHLCNKCQYASFYSRLGECTLFGFNRREEAGKILRCLNDITKECKKVMGTGIAIGVGKVKNSVQGIKESFEEAREALMYRKMAKEGQVIYMEDIDITSQRFAFFEDEPRDMLFSVIKFGDRNGIHTVLHEIQMQLKKQDMSMNACQVWLVSMLHAILLFVKQYIPAMEYEFFGGRAEPFDFMKIMGQYSDLDSFFRWMEECCFSLGEYFAKERDSKAQKVTDIAKEYIGREYGNPGISLETAAEYIGLTPAYFSGLFKKETGESFVEYLTAQRLREAKRLLDETDEKIYAIAEKAGYMDAGYFSHVFKKKYGISPIGYRRKKQ